DGIQSIPSHPRDSQRRQVLLAPKAARHGQDEVLLEGTVWCKFGNQSLMQLLECRGIFSGKKTQCGIAPVFESWVRFFGPTHFLSPYARITLVSCESARRP